MNLTDIIDRHCAYTGRETTYRQWKRVPRIDGPNNKYFDRMIK